MAIQLLASFYGSYLIVSHRLTVLPLPLYLSQLQTSSTIAVGQAMPACMTYIVISKFIKRYLKAKRARAPAYSHPGAMVNEFTKLYWRTTYVARTLHAGIIFSLIFRTYLVQSPSDSPH